MTAIMTRMLGVFLNVVGDSFSSLSLSLSFVLYGFNAWLFL